MKISQFIEMCEKAKAEHGDLEIQLPESGRDPSGIHLEEGDDWPKAWNMPDQFLMIGD